MTRLRTLRARLQLFRFVGVAFTFSELFMYLLISGQITSLAHSPIYLNFHCIYNTFHRCVCSGMLVNQATIAELFVTVVFYRACRQARGYQCLLLARVFVHLYCKNL